mmetsp:Transcript_148182/g.376593  ORF Transcript_148182/g.376593 Transcript_148182/m.376593 type:complete len:224 (-) Transcript_148182:103-774(-)
MLSGAPPPGRNATGFFFSLKDDVVPITEPLCKLSNDGSIANQLSKASGGVEVNPIHTLCLCRLGWVRRCLCWCRGSPDSRWRWRCRGEFGDQLFFSEQLWALFPLFFKLQVFSVLGCFLNRPPVFQARAHNKESCVSRTGTAHLSASGLNLFLGVLPRYPLELPCEAENHASQRKAGLPSSTGRYNRCGSNLRWHRSRAFWVSGFSCQHGCRRGRWRGHWCCL